MSNRAATAIVRLGGVLGIALAMPGLQPAAFGGMVNTLVCELRAGQEVPANASPARGCGRFVIDTNANTLSFYIVFTRNGLVGGLVGPETAAHIHGAAGPGANAGVIFPLPAGSPKVGVWNYPEAMEVDILGGKTYVNVHSTVFPGGEIRGQICKAVASLDGLQEVPPTPSAAGGWGVFVMDPCADTLSYHIVIEGALLGPETAAHIHGTAGYLVNAGVLHPLPAGSPKIGLWHYPAALEDDILQGLTYVNVHSTVFPGGEIRGQITNLVMPIDSAQEVPANGSAATGCALLSINKAADRLGFDIRHTVVGETAAHIHGFAGPGMNAGILFPLPGGPRKLGEWAYAAAQEPNILLGLTYINIHSAAFGGGEIRGQIVIPAKKPDCPWDTDGDCDVGVTDLLNLLALWGLNPGGPPDFDGDGVVAVTDLLKLLAFWGPCPNT